MSQKLRKQNYIDSHVQGALLRRIFVHWLSFFFVTALAIISLQALLGDPELPISQRVQLETSEFMFMAIIMAALFPAFMLDTIRFSNRFVGPIARLRRFLRDLKTGKTDHCAFRDNDFWNEMAHEFNDVADLVAAQQAEISDLKSKLKEAGVEA